MFKLDITKAAAKFIANLQAKQYLRIRNRRWIM